MSLYMNFTWIEIPINLEWNSCNYMWRLQKKRYFSWFKLHFKIQMLFEFTWISSDKKIMWFLRYISSCEFHEEYRKKLRLLVSIYDLNQFIHTLVWIFRHWICFRVNEIPCVGLSEWSYFVAGSVQQTSYIIFIHVCFVCLSYIYT